MDTFAKITIRLKGDMDEFEERHAEMNAATASVENAVEATLRGLLDELGRAGLKPYMDEGWGDVEVTG